MDSPKENSPPKLHTLRDLQNNKFICKRISFGDGTEHHDSGYASTSAHSTTNIEHDSMSSLSAVGSFHAPKRDCGDSCTSTLHLEPIVEDIQSGQFAQSSAAELTPTTRNIAKINSFHITTPSSPAPVKRIASSPLRHIGNTPLKTMRLNTTTPHKPKDATASDGNITSTLSGRKLWQQCREPLRSKLNVDDDNVFSMDENSNGEHPLLSSTPNNFNKLNKAKGNTITRGSNVERSRSFASRNKVLRKTISFSPSKHFQSVYERKPTATNIVSDLPAISTHSPNPARKLLDFNEDKFDKLTQPAQKILQRQYAFDTDTDYLNMSPARHTITSAQYLNEAFDIADKYDLFEAEKTPPEFPNMSMTPPKCDAMDICSPTDCVIPPPLHEDTAAQYMLKNCSSNTDSSRQIDLLLHSDIVPESPPPSQNRSNGIVDDMQRTPKKQSCGFSVFNSTPRQEQNCILYPKLQRTPPRNQRLLKRLSSNQGIQRAPVKRKLYRQASSSFIGSEKIDILGHLEDNLPAVDLVLAALSSQDLANLTRVSKRCFRIVHSNVSANKRVENYLRNQYGAKENVGCTTNTNKKIKVVRPPFTRCNSSRQILISSTKLPANSPKLSPKNENEKFLKDIKLVNSLKSNQEVMKCPRCQNISIVSNPSDPAAPRNKVTKSLSAEYDGRTTSSLSFRKQSSFPLLDRNSSTHHPSKDLMSPPSPPLTPPIGQRADEQLDSYAQCSSKRCSYRFCPKCLCEFHLNGKCLSREIGTFDDIESANGKNKEYVACSKESKRNLRRLCSLNN